nr:hypothetical protein CFP56_37208 [Quercus suber]
MSCKARLPPCLANKRKRHANGISPQGVGPEAPDAVRQTIILTVKFHYELRCRGIYQEAISRRPYAKKQKRKCHVSAYYRMITKKTASSSPKQKGIWGECNLLSFWWTSSTRQLPQIR